jgi:Ca2+-dependent lipid-binding protein
MSGAAEWKKSKEVAKLAKKKPKNDNKNIGLIDLQVEYASSVLKVTVKRMQDLKKGDIMGKADPYAMVYLTRSDKTDTILVEKGHEKTTTKKNELNPNFQEEFRFAGIELEALQGYKICVAVYDKDLVTADDFMGGIKVAARIFNQNRMNVSFTAPLLEHSTDGHPKEVELSRINFYGSNTETVRTRTSLTSPAVPPPKASPRPSRKKSTVIMGSINISVEFLHGSVLRLFVDRCENLKDMDSMSKSDPYVKIYVLNNERKIVDDSKEKTRTIKNELNPRFEEYFEFKMSDLMIRSSQMVIEVWDDDIGRDDPIGGVSK